MGFGSSADGVHWEALPPAALQSSRAGANITAPGFEIGGVAPLVNPATNQTDWYAFVCMAHQELPAAIDGRVGCFTFVSRINPGGPYELARRNYALLAYRQLGTDPEYAYYVRYYHGTDEAGDPVLLANYQVYDRAHWKHEQGIRAYMSPLKKVVLDPDDGALQLVWWQDNDKLKNATSFTDWSRDSDEEGSTDRRRGAGGAGGIVVRLDEGRGSVVEGTVTWGAPGGFCFPYRGAASPGGGGGGGGGVFRAAYLLFEDASVGIAATGESSTANCSCILQHNDTFGVTTAAPEPTRGLKLTAGMTATFRLMYRRGMYDVYINDAFIISYALPVQNGLEPNQDVLITGTFAAATPLHSWVLDLPRASFHRPG